ncbi:hypothetical protein ISS05_01450 [Candidatus Woesearchaeota archaeon]|nr:hypothetical protein [Candidatus Woesearchaeota archaeon]
MVEEGPYEILPYAEIEKLKKEMAALKKGNASSEGILDSIHSLTKAMESMLHLFESAAEGMNKEGEGTVGKKLDKVIDQNKTIAESILSLVDMVREIKQKEDYVLKQEAHQVMQPTPMPGQPPRIEPDIFMNPPSFERPTAKGYSPRNSLSQPFPSGRPPLPPGQRAQIPRGGPMPMPTGSFKDLDLNEMQGIKEPFPTGIPSPPPMNSPKEQSPFELNRQAPKKPKKGLFGFGK